MPIQDTTVDGKPAYRWGKSGKAYPYTAGDDASKTRAKKRAIRQGVAISYRATKILKGYGGRGVMIGMPIPLDIAESMGPRGVDPEAMHCTLAYLGKLDDVHPDAIRHAVDVLRDVCLETAPFDARIGGYGRFMASQSSDGKDVIYASYDAPRLVDLRQAVVQQLRGAGVPLKGLAHGFTPHITTDILDRGDQMDPPVIGDLGWVADTVCLWLGDMRLDFPLGAANAYREVEETPDASTAAAMSPSDVIAMKMFNLRDVRKESQTPAGKTLATVKIIAKDGEAMDQLVYGVVLEPDSVDGDDDVMTAADVEWTAHHFLAVQGVTGYRHRDFADATVVESYVAPCDFQMGAQLVRQGSWVLVTRVNDPDIWRQIVAGEITGYSVGGFGELIPLSGEDMVPLAS